MGKKAIQAIRPTFARMKCAAARNAFIAGIKSLLLHQPSRALHTAPTSAITVLDEIYIVFLIVVFLILQGWQDQQTDVSHDIATFIPRWRLPYIKKMVLAKNCMHCIGKKRVAKIATSFSNNYSENLIVYQFVFLKL